MQPVLQQRGPFKNLLVDWLPSFHFIYFIYLQTHNTCTCTVSQRCRSSQGLTTVVMPVINKRKTVRNYTNTITCLKTV